ncbi:hypothetical protein C8Q73DRAFT_681944 [Cubamyces lactineus]|nr:hypothetical protein C8Q73DRAFT_681944 [Cubamyces lactineus]
MTLNPSIWLCQTLLFFLALCRAVTSLATNRTIDDEKGDSVTGLVPSYSPVGSWSQGSTCSGCYIHLDTSQVFDGTWHDSTHTPGDPEPRVITAQFTGTAVYVYNALANTVPWTTTLTNLTFTLDGASAGQYVHIPTDSTDFQYDVPVFVKENLANTDHTITIEATGDTNSSLVLFDYIVYTFEDDPVTSSPPTSSPNQGNTATSSPSHQTTSAGPSPTNTSQTSSSSTSNTQTTFHSPAESGGLSTLSPASPTPGTKSSISSGAIAGGIVGGLVIVLLVGLLALCVIRRRRQAAAPLDGSLARPDPRPHVPVLPMAEREDVQHGPELSGAFLQGGSTNNHTVSGPSPFADPVRYSQPSASSPSYANEPGPSPPRADAADLTIPILPPSAPWTHSRTTSNATSSSYITSQVSDPPLSHTATSPTSSQPFLPTSATSPATSQPFLPASATPPVAAHPFLPTGAVSDEKPPIIEVVLGPPGHQSARSLPSVPPRTSMYARSEAGTISTIGESSLRAQVAALRLEVERLKQEREMQEAQGIFEEAPPSYNET